jgi:DNA topoisomerase I
VCRKSYIHPAIIDSYMDGSLIEVMRRKPSSSRRVAAGLRPDEVMALAVLQQRAAKAKKAA